MKALKFTDVRKFEYIEMKTPDISDSQILVKVMATGICHSDVVAYNGKHPYRIPPVVTGHEFSGRIVATGKAVTGFKIGDRVAVEPHIGCGTCIYCLNGRYNLCLHKKLIGVGDWSGSFAEYVAVYPSMCIPMPASMSFEEGALLEPFCVGAHAVSRIHLSPNSSAVVLGCGTIGIMTIESLVHAGVKKIIGSDISEAKCRFAAGHGATAVINPIKHHVIDEVLVQTEQLGADAVFIAAGFPGVFEQACAMTRRGGTVVIIALFDKPVTTEITPIQQGERTVCGTNMYTMNDYRWAMEEFRKGTLPLASLITSHIAFDQLGSTIDELANGKNGDEIKIMVTMKD